MPAYGRQGLAGEIVGPECSSIGYILGAQLGLDILTGGPHWPSLEVMIFGVSRSQGPDWTF